MSGRRPPRCRGVSRASPTSHCGWWANGRGAEVDAQVAAAEQGGHDAAHAAARERVVHEPAVGGEPAVGDLADDGVEDAGAWAAPCVFALAQVVVAPVALAGCGLAQQPVASACRAERVPRVLARHGLGGAACGLLVRLLLGLLPLVRGSLTRTTRPQGVGVVAVQQALATPAGPEQLVVHRAMPAAVRSRCAARRGLAPRTAPHALRGQVGPLAPTPDP